MDKPHEMQSADIFVPFPVPRRHSEPLLGTGAPAWPRDQSFVMSLVPRRASADAAVLPPPGTEQAFADERSFGSDETLGGDAPAAALARYRSKHAKPPPLDTSPASPAHSEETCDSPPTTLSATPTESPRSPSPVDDDPFLLPPQPSASPDASYPARASASLPCTRAAARLRRPSAAGATRKRVRFFGTVEVRETWAAAEYARGYPAEECDRMLMEGLEGLGKDVQGGAGRGLGAYDSFAAPCGVAMPDLRGYWECNEVAA